MLLISMDNVNLKGHSCKYDRKVILELCLFLTILMCADWFSLKHAEVCTYSLFVFHNWYTTMNLQ